MQYGLVAQQVREVLPDIVDEDASGYLSVNYQSVIPVLVEALKEQQTQNEALGARVAELERTGARVGGAVEFKPVQHKPIRSHWSS